MPRKWDVIAQHENFQELPFEEFVRHWLARNGLAQPGQGVKNSVPAQVNHGRCLVECPNCPGATIVTKKDRRFVCPACGSPENGGAWYRVDFPVKEIELELLKRPKAQNRNWEPTEGVDDLHQQNKAKGID